MKNQNYVNEVIKKNNFSSQFETIDELEEENYQSNLSSMNSSYRNLKENNLNFSGYSSENKKLDDFKKEEKKICLDDLILENKKINKNFGQEKKKIKNNEKKIKMKNKKKKKSERFLPKKTKFKNMDSFFNLKNLNSGHHTSKNFFTKNPKKISFSQDKISKHHLKSYHQNREIGNISINLDKIKDIEKKKINSSKNFDKKKKHSLKNYDKKKKNSLKKFEEEKKKFKKSLQKNSDGSLRKKSTKEFDEFIKKNIKKTKSKNKLS